MRASDTHHLYKTAAASCMVAAPLVLLAAKIVHPQDHKDEATKLASIAANPDQWYLAHLLELLAIALTVPAILGVVHMLRERKMSLGLVGGSLALLGLLAFVGRVTIEGFVGWQMGRAGNRNEMVALLERINGSAGIVIPFVIVPLAFAVGLALLALGLYRARAVQWWMALSFGAGALLLAIAGALASNWLQIAAAALLVAGLAPIGRIVYVESDEAWEHTPEYEGFRPILGVR